MPGVLQPLVDRMSIVNPDGTPTQYFIRWAQAKQIEIADSISAADALGIVQQFMTDHPISEGSGIAITPSGDIGAGITIAAEVQAILDQISTAQGSILYRGVADWEALAPGAAGTFLKSGGPGVNPSWAAGGSGGSGLFSISPPPAGLTTWVNQGAASKVVQGDGTVTIVAPGSAGDNVRGVFMPLPATPWSYKIGFLPTLAGTSFQYCGIALRESSSGKMVLFATYRDAAPLILWFIANYNSPTSKNGNVLTPNAPIDFDRPIYLRIADDGVTRAAGFGVDPYNQPFANYSVAHNSFLVPDQIGIFVDNITFADPCSISVFSWL